MYVCTVYIYVCMYVCRVYVLCMYECMLESDMGNFPAGKPL